MAIHLVVHVERVGRHRRVTDVARVAGYDVAADRIRTEPIVVPAMTGKRAPVTMLEIGRASCRERVFETG